MRVFQGQDIRQRDLRSYPLLLFEQSDLWVALPGDFSPSAPRIPWLATLLHPHQDAVQRLAEVPGLGVDSAQQIIAEERTPA